jgi:hypothetical protein
MHYEGDTYLPILLRRCRLEQHKWPQVILNYIIVENLVENTVIPHDSGTVKRKRNPGCAGAAKRL